MPRAAFITHHSAQWCCDESGRIIRRASETEPHSHRHKVYIKIFLYFGVLQVWVAVSNAVPTVNLAFFTCRKPWYKPCSNNHYLPWGRAIGAGAQGHAIFLVHLRSFKMRKIVHHLPEFHLLT
jgi:F0F1-type ATP synthase membrane subunit a